MKKSITISVPNQCHEDWSKMTPTEKGKFCAVCTKEVFDFTNTNDEELVKRVDRGENLCGRFKASQLNREIKLERKSKISLAPLAASFLLPFTLLSSTKTQATTKENKFQGKFVSLDIGKHTNNSSERIQITTTGYIEDIEGNPLRNVEISVIESGDKVFSDKKGYFEIVSLNDETLQFSKDGFDIKTMKLSRKSTEQYITLNSEIISLYKGDIEIIKKGEINIEKTVDSIPKQKQDIEITISGTVIDDTGLPLPGVNIIIKGTSNGTQTDFDGNYSLQIEKNQILVFSYVGFKTEEVTVSNINNTVDLKMVMTEEYLGEMVVVAGGISVEVISKSIMGYKERNYDPEPAPWKQKFVKAFENQKKFKQLKKERKKAARILKRKKRKY